MKYLYVLIFVGQAAFCQKDIKTADLNITKFIKNHFENAKNIDIHSQPEYLYADSTGYEKLDNEKKKIFNDYLKMLLQLERDELKKCSETYKILRHADTDMKLLKDYRLQYPDLSKVHYLVCDNRVITHIILDDKQRVISFSPNVFTTHGGRVEPFMLDVIK